MRKNETMSAHTTGFVNKNTLPDTQWEFNEVFILFTWVNLLRDLLRNCKNAILKALSII